ncbi:hypothetical protein ACEPPN_007578 [Leptodophora sp. 'Broadleaf-Isolate-01']
MSTSTPTFELTPLSRLIKQSLKDIEMMKRFTTTDEVGGKNVKGKRGKGKDKEAKGKGKGVGVGEEIIRGGGREMVIDFDKISENLKGLEEVYQAFLQTPNPNGTPRTEIHLVAIVCKRSEVLKAVASSSASSSGGGDGVPLVKVADCCL